MSDTIRVLCVFSTLDRGGAETMCMNLYRHIDRQKVQFDFVKHTPYKGAFEDEILNLGGHIYEAPRLQFSSIVRYIVWWNRFLKDHKEYRIVHGHFFTISPFYFLPAKLHGRKTIGHIHINRPNSIAKAILSHFISVLSDYPLACSVPAGQWVYRNRKFIVLKNAIDSKRFQWNQGIANAVREEFQLDNNLVVGNVSRFNEQKNPYGTLEIFRLIHEKRPNSKLLWAGDGPMLNEIRSKAIEIGINNDIIFTGVRSDVERLLQAMDAFVFPSFYEGLGIAAVEAQAAGVNTFCSTEVPAEAGVTKLCHFLPLNNLNMWVEDICQIHAGYIHEDMVAQIKNAGYDIYSTTKWLQEFYLSILGT